MSAPVIPFRAVLAELFAGAPLKQIEIDWFLRQGVPILALALPLAFRTDLVTFAGARFEFTRHRGSDDAVTAFIFPALDAEGEVADLVAWRPKSESIGIWLGRTGLLGEEQIYSARLGEPLVVHESLLDWLRAERTGVVVVDAVRAPPLLREAEPLAVLSIEHGDRIKRLLTLPAPKILVAIPGNTREAA